MTAMRRTKGARLELSRFIEKRDRKSSLAPFSAKTAQVDPGSFSQDAGFAACLRGCYDEPGVAG